MLNEHVIKVLNGSLWELATCADGEPNVVPVGFKTVSEDRKLIIGDVFMETTMKNILANGRAAVSAFDSETKEGYQVKGAAVYVTEGPVVDALNRAAEEKFGGRLHAKGAVILTPEKVIVTTPGPDNKKVL